MSKREIAIEFGNSLDKDDFATTRSLLAEDCKYSIGDKILIGPENISKSYEDNMIEGRNKLDKLEWGQSRIETINESEFFVHFTDYLTHKGKEYTHKCKQKVVVNLDHKIISIEHVANTEEQERLNNYYKSVGLKDFS